MRPDAVSRDLSGIVSQRLVARDLNIPCDWSQGLLKRLLGIRFARSDARGVQFVHKGTGTVSPNNNFVGMQSQIIRAVLEHAAWSKKDEGKNYGDHHVVMQSAAWVRPEDVALDGLTETQ